MSDPTLSAETVAGPTPPAIGTVLRSDYGMSIVVEEGTDQLGALLVLVAEEYGGEYLHRDNPVLVAALPGCSPVERWRSYSDALAEAEGIDTEEYGGWWGPGGDGKRDIWAMAFDGDAYSLGDEAWAWAVSAVLARLLWVPLSGASAGAVDPGDNS